MSLCKYQVMSVYSGIKASHKASPDFRDVKMHSNCKIDTLIFQFITDSYCTLYNIQITYCLWPLLTTLEVKSLGHVQLFATPWTVAYPAPPSMGFSQQEYCSGLPFPSPDDITLFYFLMVLSNVKSFLIHEFITYLLTRIYTPWEHNHFFPYFTSVSPVPRMVPDTKQMLRGDLWKQWTLQYLPL